ncbi:MAG: hypothetical protein JXA42_27155 [Anaerolineales bacterium]|nr:hypothetical protein [Anaerolineales bacterium]
MVNSQISQSEFKDRQRLSWTVLLISFSIFVALCAGIPIGIYQWRQRATTDPIMVLQALQGTAQVEQTRDSSRLLLAHEGPTTILPGSTIRNDAEAETLLTISDPKNGNTLGMIQIYPNTEIQIQVAKSPRYASSDSSHRIEVLVVSGRIRLSLVREVDRAMDFRSHTPHAQFLLLEAGSYSLDVSERQSQITVRVGKALIYAKEGQLAIEENARGTVGDDGIPIGPLRPAINLITNGDFREPIENDWQIRANSADPSQPAGTAELITSGGKEAISLAREGTGHAETGIYQLLNQNLSDFRSLQLHLSARMDYQSLGVCGALGSECPLMVRIDYEDIGGNPLQWVQGFYYWIDPAAPNPTVCETCPPPRQEHEQHPKATEYFYDSPNLIELLSLAGSKPSRVTSIYIYASGHSYNVQISEIELLVEE